MNQSSNSSPKIHDLKTLILARNLKAIFISDKTQYNYSGKDSLTRFGIAPEKGKRWNTPAEISSSILRDMGFSSPYEVPDE